MSDTTVDIEISTDRTLHYGRDGQAIVDRNLLRSITLGLVLSIFPVSGDDRPGGAYLGAGEVVVENDFAAVPKD
jgi:hypothetical protein